MIQQLNYLQIAIYNNRPIDSAGFMHTTCSLMSEIDTVEGYNIYSLSLSVV